MEAQGNTPKMPNGGTSLEVQKKYQLESLEKKQRTCKCCEYYGTPCRRSNLSKEGMQSQQMVPHEDEETTLQGYAHEDSLLSKAQLLRLKEEGAQPRKRTRPGTAWPIMCLDGWTITCTQFEPNNCSRIRKQGSTEEGLVQFPKSTQPQPMIPKDPLRKYKMQALICFKCRKEGHYTRECPKKFFIPGHPSFTPQSVHAEHMGSLSRDNGELPRDQE